MARNDRQGRRERLHRTPPRSNCYQGGNPQPGSTEASSRGRAITGLVRTEATDEDCACQRWSWSCSACCRETLFVVAMTDMVAEADQRDERKVRRLSHVGCNRAAWPRLWRLPRNLGSNIRRYPYPPWDLDEKTNDRSVEKFRTACGWRVVHPTLAFSRSAAIWAVRSSSGSFRAPCDAKALNPE